jgi:chlorite dismutase
LGYFYFFQFSPAYWALSGKQRSEIQDKLLAGLSDLKIQHDFYQVFPLQAEVDMLLWCTIRISEEFTPEQFFGSLARLLNQNRHTISPRLAWWGMTKPSDYARGKSSQEIDPFDGQRSTYMVVYPFSKSAAWYKLSRDTRQGMMNEHIRIGHQYPQIKQLLLYSTGLQDQEFIVTYETNDLDQFSALVTELRSSEARRFTTTDTPIFTAIHRDSKTNLDLFG